MFFGALTLGFATEERDTSSSDSSRSSSSFDFLGEGRSGGITTPVRTNSASSSKYDDA